MKAIIIEEARFAEFLILLEARATALKAHGAGAVEREMVSLDVLKAHGVTVVEDGRDNNVIPEALVRAIVDKVHRALHYEFCVWAQSHGASCTQRRL